MGGCYWPKRTYITVDCRSDSVLFATNTVCNTLIPYSAHPALKQSYMHGIVKTMNVEIFSSSRFKMMYFHPLHGLVWVCITSDYLHLLKFLWKAKGMVAFSQRAPTPLPELLL